MNNSHTERELANHEVRLENLESVVSEQTKTLKSVENKITWLGGVIATLLFLSTPQGVSIWKTIVG